MEQEPVLVELQKLNTRADRSDAVLARLDSRVGRVETRLDQHEVRFDRIDAKLTEHDARMDTFATRQDVREEGERTRNYIRVLYEDLRDKIALVAEGHGALDEAQRRTEARVESLEERTARLELAARSKRPQG